ncbi:LRR receptor-like serine/threonine-protein kinase EFR [Cornus florida]|uniref:LRR receptor-like serine/threonine-protein kinase EFR n=1 Tax=Cornus florida TaxID=4283 RepID=UPI00289DE3FE|nr:LRR receptor-like serine/threonine-protein kinase EFR [Cornus florida]
MWVLLLGVRTGRGTGMFHCFLGSSGRQVLLLLLVLLHNLLSGVWCVITRGILASSVAGDTCEFGCDRRCLHTVVLVTGATRELGQMLVHFVQCQYSTWAMSMGKHQSFVPYAAVLLLCMHMPLLYNASPTTPMFERREADRLALLDIKAKMTDDLMLQVTSSWNDYLYFCQWHGVSCGCRHQRVTVLNLQSSNLVDSISPSIGNLSFLRIINLSNNTIHVRIPHEIGLLFRLQILNLANNSLEQQIPASLSLCSNLRVLAIGNIKLIGKLPVELGSLSKLVTLHVLSNNLTGAILPSFGNLSSLEALQMGNNILEGSIPDSLGQLKSLTLIVIEGNELSANNQLEGSLPQNLGLTLPNLRRLSIWENKFNGFIPASLSNASNLELLEISMNRFSRGMSIKFGKLKVLHWLGSNNFVGALPSSIASLSNKLEYFSMGGNGISGNIPTGIANLQSIRFLNMHHNQLEGNIPASIGLLHKVQEMGFGEIPSSLGSCSSFIRLLMHYNSFEGAILGSLSSLKAIEELDLSHNNLSGEIPKDLGIIRLLRNLNLSFNDLKGEVPTRGVLVNASAISIYGNKRLYGGVPA